MVPMHSFGMRAPQQSFKIKPPAVKKIQLPQTPTTYQQETIPVYKAPLEIKPSPPATYQELIAALQNKQTVTITDFLHCLEDAKKHNLKIYFISTELINSFKEKEKILDLFKQSISNPELFKDETDTIFFQAHTIPTGSICLVSQNLYKKQKTPTILVKLTTTPKTRQDKLTILNTFNIIGTESAPQIQQVDNILFPLTTNMELDTIYDTVMAESERIKKLPKEEVPTPIISEPEKKVVSKPVVEIVQPEKQHEQIALAEKYSPLAQQIQLMGVMPVKFKDEAKEWIRKLNTGSLEPSKIDQAQKFFEDLAARRQKIEEEAAVPTISLMDLIAQLQNNETVTITNFLQALDDAKNKNLSLYFVSTDFINSLSEELQKKIEFLFSISASNPDKDNNTLFRVYTIPNGFVCLVSTSIYINIYGSSAMFITQEIRPSLDKKITILNTFNIKENGNTDEIKNQGILSFTLAANTEIQGLYDAAVAIKGVKELIEKKLDIKKASLGPEIKIEKKTTQSIITQPTQSLNTPLEIYEIELG